MMTSIIPPIFPLVVVGSGIHDYPEHRKRLVGEAFRSGLAPLLVPPSLLESADSTLLFQQLLAASSAYLGFLAHGYRPRAHIREDASPYEAEWRHAVGKGVPRRIFVADYAAHPVDPAFLTADPVGFARVVELAKRIETEESAVYRFASVDALSERVAESLVSLRSELELPPFRYAMPAPARSELFVIYAHRDDQEGRKWLEMLLPSLHVLKNGAEKIPFWYDDELAHGERWKDEIFRHIDKARVAVLLVSRHFFASEFITEKELPRIRAAADRGELRMLPVLLEDCNHDLLRDLQFAGPRREHALVPLQVLSDQERNVFWKHLERVIRARFQPASAADEGVEFPQPVADVLVQLCDTDPLIRQVGLGALSEMFFNSRLGGTAPWAWPYLEWARTQLAVLAKDPDKELADGADRLLRNLPTNVPVTVAVRNPVEQAGSPPPDSEEILDRYRDWIERTHRWLELPGIREIATIPRIELDRVFVALRGDRATAHERLESRRLLDLEVVQYARSLNQNPEALDLPALRRQLLLIDEFMPLHREMVRQSSGTTRSEQSINLAEAFRRDRWLVILGEPGSGKTTLIRWLALQLAEALRSPHGFVTAKWSKVDPSAADSDSVVSLGPARLPVLVRVADYAEERARRGSSCTLHEYLGYHPWQGQRIPESDLPPARLNQLILDHLRAGQAVVLLDGMDEIAQSELRDAIRSDINTFIEQWINGRGDPRWIGRPDAYLIDGEPWSTGGNQIVITSRIVGYQIAPLHGPLTHVIIEPMEEPAVRAFCTAWSRAVHDVALPDLPQEERAARADAEAVGLQEAVFDPERPRIRELASNPLLVTILALLYRRNDRRLPDQRVELYRTAIDVLVDDWPVGPINREELRAVLPDLAELIHRTTSTGLIEPGNLKQVLAESLTRIRRVDGQLRSDQLVRADSDDIQEFLDIALRRVGLMAGRGDLLLGFVHLTFQEYLAALWLVREQNVPATVARIQGLLDNPRWREPILLALGHAGSHIGWPEDEFVHLLRELIAADATIGDVLPRIVLMLARALEELPRVPDDLVQEMAGQLLRALAAQSGAAAAGPLRDEIDDALSHLRAQRPPSVNEVLVGALAHPQTAPVVAALIRRREWWEAPFADPLLRALLGGLDQETLGWPILMALRDYATPPLPPAAPKPPPPPEPPLEHREWERLQARRGKIASGERLSTLVKEIDERVRTLPEAVAADLAAADPDNPDSPARALQRLHEERSQLESGNALREVEARIAELRPRYEEVAAAHALAVQEHAARVAEYEAALSRHGEAVAAGRPQGQWPAGMLPLQQWLRDEPRRLTEVIRNPDWFSVFIALYGGVQDYRVGRFEAAYRKAVEAFHEFSYTYADIQDDAIYQRAVDLDDWKPALSQWSADLPFGFAPEFVFRHSPLHPELVSRFDRGEPPVADSWPERLWSHPLREVRVEAFLMLFAAGEDVEGVLADWWKSPDPGERETAAATLHALRGLLAGWRETLEHLLPKVFPRMLARLEELAPDNAEILRELLLDVARQVKDPERRAGMLWPLLPTLADPLVAEVWEDALEATWACHRHLGYDDPAHTYNLIMDGAEAPAAKLLAERYPKATFNRLFAEALCPDWAEHPDLFAEALHDLIARTPELNDSFQERLLQGKESLPDVCVAWFSVSERYSFAVILDTSGAGIPSSEEEFISFALAQIEALPPDRRARTMLRLARYLPLGFRRPPADQIRGLAAAMPYASERLATYESVLRAMADRPERNALADQAADLVSHLEPGRPRVYSLLGLLPLVSPNRQAELRTRVLEEIGRLPDPAARAAVIRQARRWTRTDAQTEVLLAAIATLNDVRRQRWALSRLSPDLPSVLRGVIAAVADTEDITLAWTLAGLAGRAEDLLSGFEQQQDANPWTLLATSEEAAIDRLLASGEKSGLILTLDAAVAVDWMRANRRDDLLKLFLPLLEQPVREGWPRVHRWLEDSDPIVVQHAALLVAENGWQITPRTFPHLLALLEGELDRSRLRAALTLHGEVVGNNNDARVLLASRLGTETLDLIGEAMHARRPDRLAPNLLETSIAAGRKRSSAKVLGWMEHRIVFDNSEMMREYLQRSAAGDPSAGAVIRLLEACSGGVLRMLTEALSAEWAVGAPGLSLTALSKLLHCKGMSYRMQPEQEDWDALSARITEWLVRLPHPAQREPALLVDAQELVASFIEAAHPVLNGATPGDLGEVLRNCRKVYGPLGEMESPGLADGVSLLEELGKRSYYYVPHSRQAAYAAVERIGTTPAVFPLLLRWLAALLREDLNDPPLARIRQLLLEVIACYAEQHPSTVAAQALDMNLLPLFCRVVTFSEHFRSRADAVLLIGTMRKLTREAAVALLSALRDVSYVQTAAHQAIDRFRYIDQDALELLLGEIRPDNDSTTAIYGAARLLAGLAASESLTALQRKSVLQQLAVVLRDPAVGRRGVYFMTGSGTTGEKRYRVRLEGRLGEGVYDALLRVAGGALQLRSPVKPH